MRLNEIKQVQAEIVHFVDAEDQDGIIRGDTCAFDQDGEQLGMLKWRSDGNRAYVDSIANTTTVPLLGVRMIKAMADYTKLPIDPGMMNREGKRLWDLYDRRYRTKRW